MKKRLSIAILIITMLGAGSCSKSPVNPDIIRATVQIDINPNSVFYQQLNPAGGWMYVKNGDPGVYLSSSSRGVIIYRSNTNTFEAYDRIPPNEPNKCGTSTMLVVGSNYPFAKDPCTGNLYQLTDGLLIKGTGKYSMIQYHAVYDGNTLHVYN